MTTSTRRNPRLERGLGIVAVVAGALAVVAGSPTRGTHGNIDVQRIAQLVEAEEDHVSAAELAQWIKDRHASLRIVDIRPDSEFAEFHIPSATRADLATIATMPLDSSATYVLYSAGGAHAAQAWVLLRARGIENAYFLRGGLYEWMTTVVNPRLPESSTRAQRDSVLELTQYFGGQLEIVPNAPTPTASRAASPAQSTVTDSTAAADLRASIKRAKRRAC
jgi:rhodanese-related sulfurtransferase